MPDPVGFLLNEHDRDALKAMLDWWRARPAALRSRGALPDPSPAPDVYVVRAPVDGIPAFESPGTGTGTATLEGVPGSADCTVHEIVDQDDGALELEPVDGLTLTVVNVGDAVAAGSWLLAARDKFGTWHAVRSVSGGAADGCPLPEFVVNVCPRFEVITIPDAGTGGGSTTLAVQTGTYAKYATIDPDTCALTYRWALDPGDCCTVSCCTTSPLCLSSGPWVYSGGTRFDPFSVTLDYDAGTGDSPHWTGSATVTDNAGIGGATAVITFTLECVGPLATAVPPCLTAIGAGYYTLAYSVAYSGGIFEAGTGYLPLTAGCPAATLAYCTTIPQSGDCTHFRIDAVYFGGTPPVAGSGNYTFACAISSDTSACPAAGTGTGPGTGTGGGCNPCPSHASTLQLSFTGGTTCSCLNLASVGILFLSYDAGTGDWRLTGNVCGVSCTFIVYCDFLGNICPPGQLALQVIINNNSATACIPSPTCGPLQAGGTITITIPPGTGGGCGTDTLTFTIVGNA